MAKYLGVDYGTYIKWERGTRKISAIGVRAIKLLLYLHRKNILNDFIKNN